MMFDMDKKGNLEYRSNTIHIRNVAINISEVILYIMIIIFLKQPLLEKAKSLLYNQSIK
jgi:hypothetical protein